MAVQRCPHLPDPIHIGHYALGRHGAHRGAAFYFDALRYGQALWLDGHSGRAILALTRALYAEVEPSDPVLIEWPLPYAAMHWIFTQHPTDDFPGNPRISFQHQATRLRGARRELRTARAWAVWALACSAKPSLTGDQDQTVPEPGIVDIARLLRTYGHDGEAALWATILTTRNVYNSRKRPR